MPTSYRHSWVRRPVHNFFGDEEEPIFGPLDQPFAAYMADAEYGVYFTITHLPTETDVDHVWRHKVVSKTDVHITAFDIRFRREANGTRRLWGNWVLADGTALPEIDATSRLGNALQISFELTGNLQAPTRALYLSSLDTAKAYYEYRIGGVLQSGGLDTPAGQIGTGFDLRDLVIEDFEIEKPVTNWGEPGEHTVNVSGEVWTYPLSTSLYPTGWVPDGDVMIYAHVDGHASFAGSGDQVPVTTSVGGHVASFSLDWDGLDDYGQFIEGYNTVTVSASGKNPDTPGFDQYSVDYVYGLIYTYFCQKDANSQCSGGLTYSSHNSGRLEWIRFSGVLRCVISVNSKGRSNGKEAYLHTGI